MLQRLAGSEEILPLPGVSRDCNSTVTDEIKSLIGTSLSKVCALFFLLDAFSEGMFVSMICVGLAASLAFLFHILIFQLIPNN